MSTSNAARIELGTAAANIAGNINALLPQLAERGAEVAKVGNEIHAETNTLRNLGIGFIKSTDDTIKPVAFDKSAEAIKALLPQLSGHGVEIDAVAHAIKGYCNQLETVHAQHLHLVDENAPVVAGLPVVNNGIGSGPFDTGTATELPTPDIAKIDANPLPSGSTEPVVIPAAVPLKVEVV